MLALSVLAPSVHAQTCNGVFLSTQAEVNAFDCVDVGALRVSGDVASLAGLSTLRTVAGEFSIRGVAAITDLSGLEQLESVGGRFFVGENAALRSLDGLEALRATGYIELRSNPVLERIDALGGTAGTSFLRIENNASLESLDGLEALALSSIDVAGNERLADLSSLSGMQPAVGSVRIRNNPSLVTLEGLSGLREVTSAVYIADNDNLKDLRALAGIQRAGELSLVGNTSARHFPEFQNGTDVQVVHLSGMRGMTSVDWLAPVGRIESLVIEDNGLSVLLSSERRLTVRSIQISDAPRLRSLSGLDIEEGGKLAVSFAPSLVDIGDVRMPARVESISLFNNVNLVNLEAFRTVESLGGLWLQGNESLQTVDDFQFVREVEVFDGNPYTGGVRIVQNSELQNLTGLGGVASLRGEPLIVTGNRRLADCSCGLYRLLNGAGAPGYFEISENADGCASMSQIRKPKSGSCSFPSAVGSTPSAFAVRIAPNPALEVATVTWGQGDAERLEVLDARGRRLVTLAVSENEYATTIDVSGWAPGVYVVRLVADGAARTGTFTVTR